MNLILKHKFNSFKYILKHIYFLKFKNVLFLNISHSHLIKILISAINSTNRTTVIPQIYSIVIPNNTIHQQQNLFDRNESNINMFRSNSPTLAPPNYFDSLLLSDNNSSNDLPNYSDIINDEQQHRQHSLPPPYSTITNITNIVSVNDSANISSSTTIN